MSESWQVPFHVVAVDKKGELHHLGVFFRLDGDSALGGLERAKAFMQEVADVDGLQIVPSGSAWVREDSATSGVYRTLCVTRQFAEIGDHLDDREVTLAHVTYDCGARGLCESVHWLRSKNDTFGVFPGDKVSIVTIPLREVNHD